MNKSDLIQLVEIRRSEAEVLLNAQKFHGAYYLIGYALECAIKVCITHQVQQFDFPNKQLAQKSHTHDLADLLAVAGLKHHAMVALLSNNRRKIYLKPSTMNHQEY